MPTQDPLAQPDIAFTPRQIKKWIKDLPMINLDSASKQTHQLIAASNRQTYPVKQRLASIELLQPLSKIFLDHHRRYLACQTFPLSPGANEIFQLQQSMNSELAIAFKIIISEVVQGDSKLDQKKLLHCIFKAISHLQQQYVSGLLMYQELPNNLWHDICQLYRVAEHYGLHTALVLVDGTKQKSTILNIFKHLCALTLISFNQLRQGEADKVNRFLEEHHELIDIKPNTDSLSGEYIYIANLATGKYPTYYIPREMPISTENRFIGYSALVSKLGESTKKFAQSTSYYLQSNEELDPELASRLITMIGNPSQRHKKRIKSDQVVRAIIGLKRIVETMTPKEQDLSRDYSEQSSFVVNSLSLLPIEESINASSPKQLSKSSANETLSDVWNPFATKSGVTNIDNQQHQDQEQEKYTDIVSSLDKWQVENFNAGGFCLHYRAEGICTTRVGDIIAVRDENKSRETLQWRVGIIRWMQGLPNKEHKVGVELFGAECACITAYNKNNTHLEHEGLLLKRIFENSKSYSLLLPSNTNLDSREIVIRGSNSKRAVMLGRTLEKTSCFSHIEVIKIFSGQ
ncbi:MAG: hypothetical protein R8G33_05835 [Gammaproteobacteria bacterium]|nr:hypothetical protein [Gammaproteobacteria bacterium]